MLQVDPAVAIYSHWNVLPVATKNTFHSLWWTVTRDCASRICSPSLNWNPTHIPFCQEILRLRVLNTITSAVVIGRIVLWLRLKWFPDFNLTVFAFTSLELWNKGDMQPVTLDGFLRQQLCLSSRDSIGLSWQIAHPTIGKYCFQHILYMLTRNKQSLVDRLRFNYTLKWPRKA